jgi:hypothetical protein
MFSSDAADYGFGVGVGVAFAVVVLVIAFFILRRFMSHEHSQASERYQVEDVVSDAETEGSNEAGLHPVDFGAQGGASIEYSHRALHDAAAPEQSAGSGRNAVRPDKDSCSAMRPSVSSYAVEARAHDLPLTPRIDLLHSRISISGLEFGDEGEELCSVPDDAVSPMNNGNDIVMWMFERGRISAPIEYSHRAPRDAATPERSAESGRNAVRRDKDSCSAMRPPVSSYAIEDYDLPPFSPRTDLFSRVSMSGIVVDLDDDVELCSVPDEAVTPTNNGDDIVMWRADEAAESQTVDRGHPIEDPLADTRRALPHAVPSRANSFILTLKPPE